MDNPPAFQFNLVTGMNVLQTKDYFQKELTAKGYISVLSNPNEIVLNIMKFSIAKDMVTIQVKDISGKSNVSFKRERANTGSPITLN